MTLSKAWRNLARAILTAIAMVVLWPYLQGMNAVQVGTVAACILIGMVLTDM